MIYLTTMESSSLFTLLFVLPALLLPSVCRSDSSDNSPTSSWAKLQISPETLCSMPYGSFRVNIYEHAYNQKSTTAPTRRKYYYAPIALLDHKSAVSDFNNVTNQAEMRFRIEMWNDQVEKEVVSYLRKIVNEQVERHQVQVIPLEKVVLASTVPSTAYSLSNNWLPYALHKSLWFTVSCFLAKDCDLLAENMRFKPHQFEHFKLLFSLASQSSQKKETVIRIDSVVSGQMVTKLLQRYGEDKEVFLTANDEKKLLVESTTKAIVETFDDSDVVSTSSESEIYNLLKDLLISSRTIIKENSDKIWDSVFWNDDNYRPDKASKTLNELYKKKGREIRKKVSDLYKNSDQFKVSEDVSGSKFAELVSEKTDSFSQDTFSRNSFEKQANQSKLSENQSAESASNRNESSLQTSGSVSGSGYGFQASVSLAYGKSSQNADSNANSTLEKTASGSSNKNFGETESSKYDSGINENSSLDKSGLSFTVRESSGSSLSSLSSTSKEGLVKFYDETKENVEWDGEKFVPKPMMLGRINLAQLRDRQSLQDRKVTIRYSIAVLSTPINFVQHADLLVTDEWQTLQEMVINLTRELYATRSSLHESEKQLHGLLSEASQHSVETKMIVDGLIKELKETQIVTAQLKLEFIGESGATVDNFTRQWQEMEVMVGNLKKELNEAKLNFAEWLQKLMNNTSVEIQQIKKRVKYRPVLQDEKKRATEEKLFYLLSERNISFKNIESLIEEGVDLNIENQDGLTPLLQLAKNSNEKENVIDTVRLLIHHGVDVNRKDKFEWNALHFLCKYYQKENLIDLIKLLIEHGIEVNLKDIDGSTAFHILCQNYQNDNLIDIIRLLIEHGGINVNSVGKDGRNVLHVLCRYYQKENLIDIIRLLIQHKVDVVSKDNEGANPLHLLCWKYQKDNLVDIVKLLIENGVDVNAKNNEEWNALHYLCWKYQNDNLIDVIKLLIQHGAKINSANYKEWSALHFLCRYYQQDNLIEIVRLLIEHGADVKSKTSSGWTALLLVCSHCQKDNLIDLIRLLIKNGAEVKSSFNDVGTALHLVCRHYDKDNLIDLIRYLIDCGIDVNLKDNNERNALQYLCRHYQKDNLVDILLLLIKNGVDVNSKTKEGWSAMLFLCRYYGKDNLIDLIRLFIQNGVDINSKTYEESTALLLLCRYYDKDNLIDIIRLLIQHGADVNSKTHDGWNAILLLCRNYQKENLIDTIRLLIENGLDANSMTNEGNNALYFVRTYYKKEKKGEIIKLLS